MSDVELATRYAPSNYPIALNNLAKRYQNTDSGEAVHYSDLGFGEISDEQAKTALRFFANIELLDNPNRANYIPPQSLVDWQLKMGETAHEGKRQVYEALMEYEVFDEIVFVLQEGEEPIDTLAEQVGGMVGIDEDELSAMEKTIEVFIGCGFLERNEEGVVRVQGDLVDDGGGEATDATAQASGEDAAWSTAAGDQPSEARGDGTSVEQRAPETPPAADATRAAITTDVEITIDATDMEPEDLKEKLEIIDEIVAHDEP